MYIDDGREYLSVTLADPALTQPVNCALLESDDGGSPYILIWSRDSRKAKTA